MNETRQRRLEEIAYIACGLEVKTKVPAACTIAVWAIESNWGAEPTGEANYHGVRFVQTRHKRRHTVEDRDYMRGKEVTVDIDYAEFDSLQASAEDFCRIVSETPVYEKSWRSFLVNKDAQVLMFDVARKYRQDPNYPRVALQIFGQSNVADAIRRSRQRLAA